MNDSGATGHVIFFKRILLLFWAVWLSVVFLSNLADAAKGLGWLGESWLFASGNLQFLRETTARYGTPDLANGVLFAGVIVWEGVATLLFWWAGWTYRGRGSGRKAVYLAMTASLLLWRLPRGGRSIYRLPSRKHSPAFVHRPFDDALGD